MKVVAWKEISREMLWERLNEVSSEMDRVRLIDTNQMSEILRKGERLQTLQIKLDDLRRDFTKALNEAD
jgi:hypothetical protein